MKITTIEELSDFLQKISENPSLATQNSIDKLKDLRIAPILIHISDKEHEHAVTAETLRALVEYQDQIYKAVKLAKYGTSSGRLPEEDKVGFDLYITFQEGSLLEKLDFQPIIDSAASKMNGWQTFGILAIGLIVIPVVFTLRHISNNKRLIKQDLIRMKERILADEHNIEIAKINAKTIENVINLASDVTNTTSKLLENLAMINGSIDIDGKTHSRQELISMAKDNREAFNKVDDEEKASDNEVTMSQISGNFLVSRIELKVDSKGEDVVIDKRMVNLVNIDTGEKFDGILVSGKNISNEQRDMIMNAIDGKPLRMDMVISRNTEGKIVGTLLRSCDGVSFETPELPL